MKNLSTNGTGQSMTVNYGDFYCFNLRLCYFTCLSQCFHIDKVFDMLGKVLFYYLKIILNDISINSISLISVSIPFGCARYISIEK